MNEALERVNSMMEDIRMVEGEEFTLIFTCSAYRSNILVTQASLAARDEKALQLGRYEFRSAAIF